MANWFEDVTKTLADEKIGRRTAIRRVAGTVVGVALASVVPGLALAKTHKQCPNGGGTCSNPNYPNCVHNSNPNCFCFLNEKGIATCGCNGFCSGIFNCDRNSNCAKGSYCAYNTGCACDGGWCIVKCTGQNKNCVLGSGHGATAAHVL